MRGGSGEAGNAGSAAMEVSGQVWFADALDRLVFFIGGRLVEAREVAKSLRVDGNATTV